MSGVPKDAALRFGIPSLDDLFGSFSLSHRAYGVTVANSEQVKLSIIGPDGTGKSILACHLASRYAADALSRLSHWPPPKIIYISTDLTWAKADIMWRAFELNRPNLREVPFYQSSVPEAGIIQIEANLVDLDLELVDLLPLDDKAAVRPTLAEFLSEPDAESTASQIPRRARIGFIDLISNPVGDIWSFCTHLLAALERHTVSADRHLIVIDNVDGFEVFTGEVNSFGDNSTVRSRIMQTVEAAAGKAHLAFVAAEKGSGSRHLSDVSDVVIRMAVRENLGYKSRTIEIEKTRAQAIQRGEHDILIRTGSGSTTGVQENPDDPRTTNAYVEVVPSLNTISRRVMRESAQLLPGPDRMANRCAGFGVPSLDELCGRSISSPPLGRDRSGLAFDSLTAIMGDPNSHKSPLAQKFVRRGFELFTVRLDSLLTDWNDSESFERCEKIQKMLREILSAREERERIEKRNTKPQDSGSAGIEEMKEKVLEAFKSFGPKLWAHVLRESEGGIEATVTEKEIEDAIGRSLHPMDQEGVKDLPSGLEPALAIECGKWVRALVTEKIEESLLNLDDQEGWKKLIEWLYAAVLPARSGEQELKKKVLPGQESGKSARVAEHILCVDILNDAIEFSIESACALKGQLPWRGYNDLVMQYNERRRAKAELAKEAFDLAMNSGEPVSLSQCLHAANDEGAAEELRNIWSGLRLDTFLRDHYPGSLDRLTEGDRNDLRGMLAADENEIEPKTILRMFAGLALNRLAGLLQDGRSNAEDMKTWLARAGFEDFGKNRTLGHAIAECLNALGTDARWRAIAGTIQKIQKMKSLMYPMNTN